MITLSKAQKILGNTQWASLLMAEFNKTYMINISDKLKAEASQGITIYPKDPFRCFKLSDFGQTNVVIIGKEPYPNNSSDGLAYSSNKLTPALEIIFRELNIQRSPDLTDWAKQGVLLLNMNLTVQKGIKLNWPLFTSTVLRILSLKKHTVFMLWGERTMNLAKHIDQHNNLVLMSEHPQAGEDFLGCGHFETCNKYLIAHGKKEIKWK
jgi:uracil-DNA glycosylase